jgi:hypothetical protein
MLPYSMIAGGQFNLTTALIASGVNVQCISQNPPDYILLKAITGFGRATNASATEWWWERSMAQGTANGYLQSSAAANSPAVTTSQLTSGGIYTYDTASPPTFAPLAAATAVTRGAANGVTVVTVTNDGTASPIIIPGNYVRLTNVVGMEQISGMTFLVVATTSTTSITIDLDSSAFAADGTAAVVRQVIRNKYYPKMARITAISKANPCVVNCITNTDFTIGEEVTFNIPSNFSGFTTMQEIKNLHGVVTAVTPATATTCSQVTVNINTSGFTTFVLPTSAQYLNGIGQDPIPALVPAGSGVIPNQNPPGMNIVDAFDNRNIRLINFNAGLFNVASHVSTNGDSWMWQAYKYDDYSTLLV